MERFSEPCVPAQLLLHLVLHVAHYPYTLAPRALNRKLKKLLRELKNKNPAVAEKEEERPPQQWNLDYALAPFEGLTPEYMEMSEYTHIQYTHTHTHRKSLQKQRAIKLCGILDGTLNYTACDNEENIEGYNKYNRFVFK